MRTPKAYTEALKNNTITAKMLEDCLYSVNKRAKNYRDKDREIRYRYGRRGFHSESNEAGKAHNYACKELFLELLQPICIHKEFAGYPRTRVYDYEKRYRGLAKSGAFVWENCYYDHDEEREVWFGDIEDKDFPQYRYYLFYELGEHSFHTPIGEFELEEYPELEVKEIDELDTYGDDIENLASVPFIKKVINLILSGNYKLDFTDHVNPNPDFSKFTDLKTEEPTVKMESKTTQETPAAIVDKHITTVLHDGEEMPVKEYIGMLANKKSSGISKDEGLKYAAAHGMEVTKKTLLRDAVQYILDQDLHYDVAEKFHLGVTKYDYNQAGMTDKEYRKLTGQKKLIVIGQYESDTRYGTQMRNLYDIRQYLRWRSTGVA